MSAQWQDDATPPAPILMPAFREKSGLSLNEQFYCERKVPNYRYRNQAAP